jgi:hypothetical protein
VEVAAAREIKVGVEEEKVMGYKPHSSWSLGSP